MVGKEMTATLLKTTLFFVPMFLFLCPSHLWSFFFSSFFSHFLGFFLSVCIHSINIYFHPLYLLTLNALFSFLPFSYFVFLLEALQWLTGSLENITIITINIIKVISFSFIPSFWAWLHVSCTRELPEMNSIFSGLGGTFFESLTLHDSQSARLNFGA